jgi:8-oxo-dGTP pyrophosphatase MutT (NUDIX family)
LKLTRDPGAAKIRPRDAATLILLDRTKRQPRVLMGRRNPKHVFMPGKFVFPGGRVDPHDRAMAVAGALHHRTEAALSSRSPRYTSARGRALALAAVRETYEETGILLGSRDYGAPEKTPPGSWEAFKQNGVFPELDALHLIARAITPPNRVRRFDTRFFAADRSSIACEVPGIVGPDSELSDLEWVTLPAARKLDLPDITRAILQDLEERISAGFMRELPVPFYYAQRGTFQRELL